MKNRMIVGILCGSLLAASLAGCASGNNKSTVTYDSVESINQEAQAAYDSGDYKGALTKFAEAVSTNPIDMTAQLGAARCQIALENYDMARTNLNAAGSIDPKNEELYDVYLELSKASGILSYAQSAVRLAERNQVDSFLAKLPEPPVLSQEGGVYDSKIELTVTVPDPDAEIMVEERKDNDFYSYRYGANPIGITHGDTDITVYCVKDGVPSRGVEAHFTCEYDPVEVKFEDRGVEMLVHDQLSIPEGSPITDVDCEQVKNLRSYELLNLQSDTERDDRITIRSLADVIHFPNLTQIDLEEMDENTDYSPLEGCHKLSRITVENSGLTNLAPFANIGSLTNLNVSGNPINDFSALKDLKLIELSFDVPADGDLSFIKVFSETLEWLDLYNCGGKDLSVVGEMTKLTNLFLNNEPRNFRVDEEYEEKPLGDLSFLQNLPDLEWLRLDGMENRDALPYIKNLSNLQILYLYLFGDYDSELRSEESIKSIYDELHQALPACQIDVR